MIYRIFVEKKDNVQARQEANNIRTLLGIEMEDLRLVLRYDVEGMTQEELDSALGTVFSEPPVDNVCLENLEIPEDYKSFWMDSVRLEVLGQFLSCQLLRRNSVVSNQRICETENLSAISGISQLFRISDH